MNKILLMISMIFSLSATVFAQAEVFFEDFESFIAGQQVACQDPVNWTTWSGLPCSAEDAYVSTNYAHSAPNSFVLAPANDFVKPLGDKTTGKWWISFWVYLPTGKDGYFNTLNTFPATASGHWGMEVYFDAGGAGRLLNGATVNFTWTANTWQYCETIVDLDLDQAQFWFNGSMVAQWQWTRGTPGTYALRVAANDFYGPLQTIVDECYFDDFRFADSPSTVKVEDDINNPLTFDLAQNYPNPFNPSTNIKFSVPEAGNVKLSVYNLVGEEVAVLVNGFSQAGTFEATFDASNLSTGVYLYKLQSTNSVQTKKMMLLK